MQAPSAPGSLEVPLNNNILGQSNADDVSSDGGSSDGGEQQVGEVNQEFNGIDSSSNGPARKRARGRTKQPRKGNLQGRFSGRLETKMDEKRLLDECRLLGPLLGGVGKRGEKSRLTLAKIVRGIASGEIRQHCEQRERELQVYLLFVWGCAPPCPHSFIFSTPKQTHTELACSGGWW